MAKNPNYWEPGLPYLDQVNIKVFNDQPAMVVALESGAIDMAFRAADPGLGATEGRSEVERLQQRRARSVLLHAGERGHAADGQQAAPSGDRLRASTGSASRTSIMKGFAGIPKDLPWPTASAAYEADKNNAYTLDLDKAKSLVEHRA